MHKMDYSVKVESLLTLGNSCCTLMIIASFTCALYNTTIMATYPIIPQSALPTTTATYPSYDLLSTTIATYPLFKPFIHTTIAIYLLTTIIHTPNAHQYFKSATIYLHLCTLIITKVMSC